MTESPECDNFIITFQNRRLSNADLKYPSIWAGEMAQRLRALTALPEVLSSFLSNHMVAHSHL